MTKTNNPRCKGVILPTMRSLPVGVRKAFPLERLGALRTGSWYLSKWEGMYYSVHKGENGVIVTRNL